MSRTSFDSFDRASQTAYSWLREVADSLGTDDRRFAYRVLRAWLHALRDRLSAEGAADFAAGLPELLRGAFYDGWRPAHVPIKYGPAGYRARFAREAGIAIEDVDAASGAVTAALRTRLANGQLEHALKLLPHELRRVLRHPVVRRNAELQAAGRHGQ
jgi:uncharacterized protein (DUF2267 family)